MSSSFKLLYLKVRIIANFQL